MEVSGKEFQFILNKFIEFIDKNYVEGFISEFDGSKNECVNEFIRIEYTALWNEKMRNS